MLVKSRAAGLKGVREAETPIERKWIILAHLDWFFERYGWTYEQYMDAPRWITKDIPRVVDAKIEGAKQAAEQRERQAKIKANQASAGAKYGGP